MEFTTSQLILHYVMNYHTEQYQPNEYTEILKNNFYVDNLHQTNNHPEELIKFYKIAIDRFMGNNLNVRSCSTHSEEFKSIMVKKNTISQHDEDYERASRYNHCPNNDRMTVTKMVMNKNVKTKKQILAQSARVFYPLLSYIPVAIGPKLILRKLWFMKSNWDQEVPEDTIKKWSPVAEDLYTLSDISFPREAVNTKEPLKLYIFCDSSPYAYSFVVYAVQGRKSHILFAKGKVAPLELKSTPTMELLAVFTIFKSC